MCQEAAHNLRHPIVGTFALEYSAFAVDGRPDLGMVVYNPATAEDVARIRSLLANQTKSQRKIWRVRTPHLDASEADYPGPARVNVHPNSMAAKPRR